MAPFLTSLLEERAAAMERVKVLEVLEANVGGARKHVFQILRGLDREQFDVHLACSLERDPAAAADLAALRAEGVRVATVRMVRRPSPLSDLRALGSLRRLMSAERYGLVHTHAAKAGFLGRLAARRAGVLAVLHTPHTFPFEREDTVLAPLYRFLERWAARWADRIVLVAESQRATALAAGLCEESRLAVVPNGVRLPAEEPAEMRRRYRAELGIGEAALAVAFAGRITPQKDVQTFLSAAAQVRRQWPEVQAFVVGGADNARYLRSLRPPLADAARRVVTGGAPPSEPVVWCPALPVRVLGHRADAAQLMAAFDVVVLPSRYEGLPYSLLEAMAWGVPVVASDVTGNRDVIEEGRSGLLVPRGDVAGFVRGMVRVLTDGELRSRLGAAARERVATSFTEERFLRQITSLYDSVCAPRGKQ